MPTTSFDIEHFKDCEAKEWLSRYAKQPPHLARYWWDKVITDITRIRGKEAAEDLRRRMNLERLK